MSIASVVCFIILFKGIKPFMLPLRQPSLDSPGYKLGNSFLFLRYYINTWIIVCFINKPFFGITVPGVPLQLIQEVDTCKWICWEVMLCQRLQRKVQLLKTAGSAVISWDTALTVFIFISTQMKVVNALSRSVFQQFILCKSHSSGWFKRGGVDCVAIQHPFKEAKHERKLKQEEIKACSLGKYLW